MLRGVFWGWGASKGSGPDGIPYRILKSYSDGFRRPLTLLFNRSLSERVFPESWKRYHVVSKFKGGKLNLIDYYRGIAILSALPKLFELLVFESLFLHLKSSIAVVQDGFFKGRSAFSNLMVFASLCIRRMEEGIQMDAIYIDFSKAFDRINHLILLAKLRNYGIVSKLNSNFQNSKFEKIRFSEKCIFYGIWCENEKISPNKMCFVFALHP
jgi:hypothetical protein